MGTSQSIGKKFEAEVHKDARHLTEQYPCVWRRIPDSGSAGNLMPTVNPADFELSVRYKISEPGLQFRFFFECKASEKFETLADGYKKLIKVPQLAALRVEERAGAKGYFLFHHPPFDEIEVWKADRFFEVRHQKGIRHEMQPDMRISVANYRAFFESFCNNPVKAL